MANFFQILGVTPAATPQDISAAFKLLSRQMHPDAGGDTTKYQELTDAYGVLKDDNNRRSYIRWLELTQTQCPNCKGLGVQWQQRGFRGGEFMRCPICNGGGFHEKQG